MNKAQRKHENTVDGLVKRLYATGRYKWIQQHQEYFDGNRIVGECDVWAKRLHSDRYVCFEVKGHNCQKSRHKAKDQLYRTVTYLNGLHIIPVYVSPDRVQRYYFNKEVEQQPPEQLELGLCEECNE